VGPRETFARLERSRVLQRVDDAPVWSVVCFFVAPEYRRCGLTVPLLREAVRFARTQGARIVEGYPTDAGARRSPDAFVWMGLLPAFERAGFREVLRRSPARPIMRTAAGRGARAARRKASSPSR
jgi:GNAT superfamily N-acetyltransferase